jgi:hypothetical protein
MPSDTTSAKAGSFAGEYTLNLGTYASSVASDGTVISGEDHGGVIFVSSKSFAQNDHAGLAAALAGLWQSDADADWTNRIVFLSRAAGD